MGKIPLDVNAMNIDLLSISGHKLYGPKGVGALYIRRRPRVRLEPQMNGGGQERGLRSGTVPHFLVAGGGVWGGCGAVVGAVMAAVMGWTVAVLICCGWRIEQPPLHSCSSVLSC